MTPNALILTNLPVNENEAVKYCECHDPRHGSPKNGSEYGLLDTEHDWGMVTEPTETYSAGRAEAVKQRHADYNAWKRTIKSVGVYGLPIMLNDKYMTLRSTMLSEALTNNADWFCPTLYDEVPSDPAIVMIRARWARQCIDGANQFVRQLPLYGCICPRWKVNGVNTAIPDARMVIQIAAAKHELRARGLYIWDSLSWRVWQAKLKVAATHPAYPHVQEARKVLSENYGFMEAEAAGWDAVAVDRLAIQYSTEVVNNAIRIWGTV